MEHLGLNYVIGPAIGLGLPGLIFVVWYFSQKAHERTLLAYREDTIIILKDQHTKMTETQMQHQETVREILAAYKEDTQIRERMYDSNIVLVKSFERLAQDQKDVIITNTQALTRLSDTLQFNRLCPNIRAQGDG